MIKTYKLLLANEYDDKNGLSSLQFLPMIVLQGMT